MIKISIIVPVYNVEQYLKRCLDSITNQTLKDIEIICVNDCSCDNSLNILENYSKKDNRIKLINFTTKQNAAIARNEGINIAKGDYLGFVDADDYIDIDFYEKLYKKAREKNYEIVKGNNQTHTLDGRELINPINQRIKNGSKIKFNAYWWSAIYKTDFIKSNSINFPIQCPKAQDAVFLHKCILKAKDVVCVDDTFYHYIRRNGSLDSAIIPLEHAKSALLSCQMVLDEINKNHTKLSEDEYIFIYTRQFEILLANIYKNDDLEMRREIIQNAIKYYKLAKYNIDSEFQYQMILNEIKNEAKEELLNKMNGSDNFNEFKKKNEYFKNNILNNTPKEKEYYCPYCSKEYVFKDFGNPRRKNVMCPNCYSLERHRFLYYVYDKFFIKEKRNIKILHTAPEKCIVNLIKEHKNIEYYPIDIEPSNYNYCKCIKQDATALSFEDNYFDYILSNHVIEHIEDEKKFISEMLRVLKHGGKMFLTFPIYFDTQKTFQDKSIKTPQDRQKYYGQYNHVIKYGKDVINRLKKDYGAEFLKASLMGGGGIEKLPNQDVRMNLFLYLQKNNK